MSSLSTTRISPVPISGWLPAVLLAALILIPPGLNLAQYWLHNPLYGYGLWVPVLAVVLARQRGAIANPPREGWLTATVIAGYFAMLPVLRVVQVANPDWRMIDWLLAGGAVAALLALTFRIGGPALLGRWWFPICFLLTAVPWSTSAEHAFTTHAVPATATIVSESLWTVGIAAVDEGRTLRTAVGPIGVSEDCSGIRGVQLAVMAALFWGCFLGLTKGRALVLLFGGIGLALFLNVLRVAVIVGAAVQTGQLATADRLHDPAGTAAQIALMLALPTLAWCLRQRNPTPPKEATKEKVGRLEAENAGAVSSLTALCAAMWFVGTEVAAENWFRIHETRNAPAIARWTLNRASAIPGAVEQPMPAPVQENYRYSDSLVLDWKDKTGAGWRMFWLDFEKGALSACTHNVHRPDTCLPAQDFNLARQFPDLQVDLDGTSVAFHHQLFQSRGQVLHVFFVTAQDVGSIGQQTQTDWTMEGRLRAAALGLRSQRSQMVHLLLDAPRSPANARQMATEYIRQLLVIEKTAKS